MDVDNSFVPNSWVLRFWTYISSLSLSILWLQFTIQRRLTFFDWQLDGQQNDVRLSNKDLKLISTFSLDAKGAHFYNLYVNDYSWNSTTQNFWLHLVFTTLYCRRYNFSAISYHAWELQLFHVARHYGGRSRRNSFLKPRKLHSHVSPLYITKLF